MRNKDILLLILIIAVVVVVFISFKNSIRDYKNYIISKIPEYKNKINDMIDDKIEEEVEDELERRKLEYKSSIIDKLSEYKDIIKDKLFSYKDEIDKSIDEKINDKIKEYEHKPTDNSLDDDSSEDYPDDSPEDSDIIRDIEPPVPYISSSDIPTDTTTSSTYLDDKLKSISEMTKLKNDIEGIYDVPDNGSSYYFI